VTVIFHPNVLSFELQFFLLKKINVMSWCQCECPCPIAISFIQFFWNHFYGWKVYNNKNDFGRTVCKLCLTDTTATHWCYHVTQQNSHTSQGLSLSGWVKLGRHLQLIPGSNTNANKRRSTVSWKWRWW